MIPIRQFLVHVVSQNVIRGRHESLGVGRKALGGRSDCLGVSRA